MDTNFQMPPIKLAYDAHIWAMRAHYAAVDAAAQAKSRAFVAGPVPAGVGRGDDGWGGFKWRDAPVSHLCGGVA